MSEKTRMRPALVRVPEEMKRRTTLLADEVLSWPDVRLRRMFGMRALYRGGTVFAMLPDKRALEDPEAIAYKLHSAGKLREGRKWHLLRIPTDRAIQEALRCLQMAYGSAQPPKRK